MSNELCRFADAWTSFQKWDAFPPEAIVLVKNAYGESRIGPARKLWWGYQEDGNEIGEGVIIRARRLDRPAIAERG